MIEPLASTLPQSERPASGDARARMLSVSSKFLRLLRDGEVAAERARSGQSAAKPFGEEGFFQPPVPWNRDRIETRRPARAAGAASISPETASARAPARSPASDTAESEATLFAIVGTVLRGAPSAVGQAPTPQARRASGMFATSTPPTSVESARGAESERTSTAPAQLLRQAATASLPVRVSVQAIAHGLAVRVAIDQLDPAEQRELTDRIRELLSRHGLIDASISLIGGRASLSPPKQGQDLWR